MACDLSIQKNVIKKLIAQNPSNEQTVLAIIQSVTGFKDYTIEKALSEFEGTAKTKLVAQLEKVRYDFSKKDSSSKEVEEKPVTNINVIFTSPTVTDLFDTLHVAEAYFENRVNYLIRGARMNDKNSDHYTKNDEELNRNFKKLKNDLFETIVRFLKKNGVTLPYEEYFVGDTFTSTLYNSKYQFQNYDKYKEILKALETYFLGPNEENAILSSTDRKIPNLKGDIRTLADREKFDAYNAAIFLANFDTIINKYKGNTISMDFSRMNQFTDGTETEKKYKLNATGEKNPYWLEDSQESEGVTSIEDDVTKEVIRGIEHVDKNGNFTGLFLDTTDFYSLASFIREFERKNLLTILRSKKEDGESGLYAEWVPLENDPRRMLEWYIKVILDAYDANFDKTFSTGKFKLFSNFRHRVDIIKSIKNFLDEIKLKESNSRKPLTYILTQALTNSYGANFSTYNSKTLKLGLQEMHSHNAERVSVQNSVYAHLSANHHNTHKFWVGPGVSEGNEDEEKELKNIEEIIKTDEGFSSLIYKTLGIYIGTHGADSLRTLWGEDSATKIRNYLLEIRGVNYVSEYDEKNREKRTKMSLFDSIAKNESLIDDSEYDEVQSESSIIESVSKKIQDIIDVYLDNFILRPIMTTKTLGGDAIPTYKVPNLMYSDTSVLLDRYEIEQTQDRKFKSIFLKTDKQSLLGTSTGLEIINRDKSKNASKLNVDENFRANFLFGFLDPFRSTSDVKAIQVMIGNYADKSTIMHKMIDRDTMINGKYLIGHREGNENISEEELANLEGRQKREILPMKELLELVRTQSADFYSDYFDEVFEQYSKLNETLAKKLNTSSNFDSKVKLVNDFLNTFKSKDDFLKLIVEKQKLDRSIKLSEEQHYSFYNNKKRIALNQTALDYYRIFNDKTNFNKFVEDQEKSFVDTLIEERGGNILFDEEDITKLNNSLKRDKKDVSEKNAIKAFLTAFDIKELDYEPFYPTKDKTTKDAQGNEVTTKGRKGHSIRLSNGRINPIVQRFIWVNNLLRNDYLLLTVKPEFMHPHKNKDLKFRGDNPNVDFKETYLEISGRIPNMSKRNVSFTATYENSVKGAAYSPPVDINIACIDDVNSQTYNYSGATHNQDIHDGSSLIAYAYSRMIEDSYPGKSYEGTKKRIATYLTEFGSALKKDAETVLTNDKIRNSNKSNIKFKIKQKQMLSSVKMSFIEEFTQSKLPANNAIFYKNGKYYKINSYQIMHEEGSTQNLLSMNLTVYNPIEKKFEFLANEDPFGKNIKINTLYDIWEAFGGEFSAQMKNGEFVFSEDSNEMLYDLVTSYKGEKENYPLKKDMIHIVSNHTAFKSGATNINPSSAWVDDTNYLGYSTFKGTYSGPQLDAGHEAEASKIKEITQIISALAQNSKTAHIAEEVYEDIARIIKESAKPHLKKITNLNDKTLEQYYHMLSKGFAHSLANSDGKSLAKSIAEAFGNGAALPFSHQSFFREFTRDLITKMNNEFIVRYYQGIGAVLNPSHGIIQLFEDSNGNVFKQEDIIKRAFNWYSNLGEDLGLSNEEIIDKYLDDNFKPMDISIGDVQPGDTIVIEEDDELNLEVKPGVEELFESNPELANDVYEALGFNDSLETKLDELGLGFLLDSTQEQYSIDKNKKHRLIKIKENTGEIDETKQIASYDPITNTIILSKNATLKEIIHELIHHVLHREAVYFEDNLNIQGTRNKDQKYIDKGKVVGKKLKEHLLNNVRKYFGTEISKLLDYNENSRSYFEELLTYYLTSKEFRKELDSLPEEIKNEILEIINELLGNHFTSEQIEIIKEQSENNGNNQIAPQQKQQAQQLYSQYLEQNPNGSIEGFKSWVDNNQSNVQYQLPRGRGLEEFVASEKTISSITNKNKSITLDTIEGYYEFKKNYKGQKLKKVLSKPRDLKPSEITFQIEEKTKEDNLNNLTVTNQPVITSQITNELFKLTKERDFNEGLKKAAKLLEDTRIKPAIRARLEEILKYSVPSLSTTGNAVSRNYVSTNVFDLEPLRLRYELNKLIKGDSINVEDKLILDSFAKHWGYKEGKDSESKKTYFDLMSRKLNAWTQRNLDLLDSRLIMKSVKEFTNLDGTINFKAYFGKDTLTNKRYDEIESHYINNNSIPVFNFKFKAAELILPNMYKNVFDMGDDSIEYVRSVIDKDGNNVYFNKKLEESYKVDNTEADFKVVLDKGENTLYVKYVTELPLNLSENKNLFITEYSDKDSEVIETRMSSTGKSLYVKPKNSLLISDDKTKTDTLYIKVGHFTKLEINKSTKKDVIVLDKNLRNNLKDFIKSFKGQIRGIVPLFNSSTPINNLIKDLKTGEEVDINNLTFNTFKSFTGYINTSEESFNPSWFEHNRDQIISQLSKKKFATWEKSLNIISSRIPAQSMQSFMAMTNRGYFNTTLNDAYVSIWQIFLQGSDFDIDKAYIMGYGFNKNGQYDLWTPFNNYSTTEQLDALENLPMPTGVNVTLTNNTNAPDLTNEFKVFNEYLNNNQSLRGKSSEQILSELNLELTTDVIKSFVTALYKIKDIPEGNNKEVFVDENIELLPNVNLFINLLNRHNSDTDYLRRDNAIKNSVVARIGKIISAPSNQLLANEPVSTKVLHDAAKVAQKKLGYKEEQFSSWNILDIYKQQLNASIGKDDVGIGANGLKVLFALSNYYNSYYNKLAADTTMDYTSIEYLKDPKTFVKTFTINDKTRNIYSIANTGVPEEYTKAILASYGYDELQKENARLSEEQAALHASGFTSGATDNAKELVMAKINAVVDLASMHLYLITLGYSMEDVAVYMNSDLAKFVAHKLTGNLFKSDKPIYVENVVENYIKSLVDSADKSIVDEYKKYQTLKDDIFEKSLLLNTLEEEVKDDSLSPEELEVKVTKILSLQETIKVAKENLTKISSEASNLINKINDSYQFLDIYAGGQEFKTLASVLKVNQKTSANIDELNKFLSNLETTMFVGENNTLGKFLGRLKSEELWTVKEKYTINGKLRKVDLIDAIILNNNTLATNRMESRKIVMDTLSEASNIPVSYIDENGFTMTKEVSLLGGQFDFRYYMHTDNDQYRAVTIKYYNLFKNTVNIFDVIENSPHFKQMVYGVNVMHTVLATYSKKYNYAFNRFRDITRKYANNLVKSNTHIKNIRGNDSFGIKINDIVLSKVFRGYDSSLISSWLRSKGNISKFSFNPKELMKLAGVDKMLFYTSDAAKLYSIGELKGFAKTSLNIDNTILLNADDSTDFVIDLTTDYGIANFKMLMETVILELLKKSKKSDLSNSLRLSSVKGNFGNSSNQIVSTFKISDMKSPINIQKFQALISSFNEVDSKIEKDLWVNNTENKRILYKDLFYVYNLVVNNEMYGNKRLTPLFDDYIKSPNTIGYDYLRYAAKVDAGKVDIFEIPESGHSPEEVNLHNDLLRNQEFNALFQGFNLKGTLAFNTSQHILTKNANFTINTTANLSTNADTFKYQTIESIVSLISNKNLIINYKCN